MNADIEYDMSRLGTRVSELIGALVGRGASNGDIQRALTVEAGQCAWKIAQALGPSSKKSGEDSIRKDAGTVMTWRPETSNLTPEQQHSSYAGFEWLAAGPNFLTGINTADNMTDASVSDAMQVYYDGRKAAPRGKKYVELGKRGRQRVMRINRIRVVRQVFSGVVAAVAEKVGQSKAAFARTTMELLPSKRIPAWIERQILNVMENGKSVFSNGTQSDASPFVEFGSRAKGVTSNPWMSDKIRGGIKASELTLSSKLKKIVQGHTYNWNTGQVFKPTEFDEN